MRTTSRGKAFLPVLALLLCICLAGCGNRKQEEERTRTGEFAYVTDARFVEQQCYVIKPDETIDSPARRLYLVDEQGETLVRSFSGFVRWSEAQSAYFFLDGTALALWEPVSGTESTCCLVDGAYTPVVLGKTYALLEDRNHQIFRLTLSSGDILPCAVPVRAANFVYQSDSLLFGYDYQEDEFFAYDMERDLVLWQAASPVDGAVLSCEADEGLLYYVQLDGRLRVFDQGVSYEIDGAEAVVAVCAEQGTVYCARELGHYGELTLSRIEPDGGLTDLACWEKADYYLNGSCRLLLEADKLLCAVSTNKNVFLVNLNPG